MANTLHIYKRIKETRQDLGMSQTDLALKVGYKDKTMISHIENGKIDLPTTKLAEIAKALGVTPGYLMGWEDKEGNSLIESSKDPEAERAMELYELYRKASPEIQAAVEILLKKATPGS